MRFATRLGPCLLSASLVAGCAAELDVGPGDTTKSDDKSDSSAEAVFVDLDFDGELLTDFAFDPKQAVEDQLLYTIGHLNGDRAVGRLDRLDLSGLESSKTADGRTRIAYHARLPVAWGKKNLIPTTYTLTIPRDIGFDSLQQFSNRYQHSCVDAGAHEVGPGNLWYYYRPHASGCHLADADVLTVTAGVSLSAANTTGKFPEYDKVWEDDVLRVVAIFGKYEDGATTTADAGIEAYDRFVAAVRKELAPHGVTTTPANVPSEPGVAMPDVLLAATLADGKRVEVVALLVDNVRTGGAAFDARYEELSTRADLITYNGHAGLGTNVRALARKGSWTAGQYVIVFLNGCDTFAYVDDALADAHSMLNADDPNGTKYLDTVLNGMPAFFSSMPDATVTMVRGLLSYDQPRTYQQIFARIDRSQVVMVTGEQDNAFVPGGGGGGEPPVAGWSGLSESGTLARGEEKRVATPVLPAGRYLFEMTGTGDADLHVRVGTAPTAELFDCRPFKNGSNESCEVELPAPAAVHVLVLGWAQSSGFELVGRPE